MGPELLSSLRCPPGHLCMTRAQVQAQEASGSECGCAPDKLWVSDQPLDLSVLLCLLAWG